MVLGRARATVVLLAALATASFLPSLAVADDYAPFESQTDVSSDDERVTHLNWKLAQSFAPTANFTLTRLGVYVEDRGATDALDVRIVPDGGGVPDEGTVLASGVNDTDSFAWANFTFGTPVALTSGSTYWIVAASSNGAGQGYAWRYTDTDAYPRGSAASSLAGNWSPLPGDFAFVAYGFSVATVALAVTSDRASIASGERIEYTIGLTNTGTWNATDAWINATLDARLQFGNVTGPGTATIAGHALSVSVATIPTGTTEILVEAFAGPLLGDGDSVPFPVTAEYDDGTGARESIADTAVVEVHAPRITATLSFFDATVHAGGLVTFHVLLENRGRMTASHVWMNETLHPSLTFLDQNSTVLPTLSGANQAWHFRDLAPGTSSFAIVVQVDPRAAVDTIVTNYLSIEFTDALGEGLARDRSNTVWFTVTSAVSPEEPANPWLWGSFAISASIVGGTYLAFARRRLRIEEIFLIHKSGVLLVHMSKSLKADQDTDILSGMFTAILNFVRDAFHYEERQELTGLDLGRFQVHVRKASMSYLALVHSGKPGGWISKVAERALDEVEAQFSDMLVDWDGDVSTLAGIREILREHFLSPTGPSRSWRAFRAWLRTTFARANQTFKPVRPL